MKKTLIMWVHLLFVLLLISCGTSPEAVWSTDHLEVAVDRSGHIVALTDLDSGRNELATGRSTPLLSLFDSDFIHPTGFSFDESTGVATLRYPNGSQARIQVSNRESYLRFEVLSVEPRAQVTKVVWGPYVTRITDIIGETVAVVQNDQFAFGIQSLEINTAEGPAPEGFLHQVIDPLPGQVLPDSLKDKVGTEGFWNVFVHGDIPPFARLYRGFAAAKMPYGSVLTLHAKDWRTDNIPELEYEPYEQDFVGSAIAMFGVPGEQVLDRIEYIALNEGLPRIEIEGEWVKRSPRQGEAYMSFPLTVHNVDTAIEYSQRFGFRMIHIRDIFQSWGQFNVHTPSFPEGEDDLRWVTERLKNEGILIGPHTLTLFTHTHDPYVSPIPSDSLLISGRARLARPAGDTDEVIYVEDPDPFRDRDRTGTVKIGKELMNYAQVSDQPPWRLMDVRRGVYNTQAASHTAGSYVDKLVNNDYNGFYPDINLQDAYADRFAEICNLTGIQHLDFDGYGAGYYGANRFIQRLYDQLDNKNVIVCAAGTGHYFWHIYMQMNWGEPWYDNIRESMIDYRLENVRYFNRNLTRGMLGWFMIQRTYRPEENQFIQALSTGWDAGYLLYVSQDDLEGNAYKDEHFRLVKDWQDARKARAFSEEQLAEMRDRYRTFHLERLSETEWNWHRVSYDYDNELRAPEQGAARLETIFTNEHATQPAEVYLRARSETLQREDGTRYQRTVNRDARFTDIAVTINGVHIEVPFSIRYQENIHITEQGISLHDPGWNVLDSVQADIPLFHSGDNEVVVTGRFEGQNGPVINAEFKAMGPPERVEANVL